MAAKLGTGAAIIVHETVPAAYPWSVVENSDGKENFAVRSDAPNPDYPSVAAGLHQRSRSRTTGGRRYDYDALKALAVRRDFRPIALGATVSFDVQNLIREVDSQRYREN